MNIHEFGDPSDKTILLMHPMFLDAATMIRLVEPIHDRHHFIVPDLSAHGEDRNTFLSTMSEAEYLHAYLLEKKYRTIDFVLGCSLGARVVLDLLALEGIHYRRVVLDGTLVFEKSGPLGKLFERFLIRQWQKAQRKPGWITEKMIQRFGELGTTVGSSFERIDKESIQNIFKSSSSFPFYKYSRELQESITFEYGSRDYHGKQKHLLAKAYPHAEIRIHEGYKHCEHMYQNKELYFAMMNE